MRKHLNQPRQRDLVPKGLAFAIGKCCSGRSAWPLYLYGPAGTGKTCGALVLADRVSGWVGFIDFAVLCDALRRCKMGEYVWSGTHGQTQVDAEGYWVAWAKLRLCIIDEVGSRGDVSDHQYETLKAAIDARFNSPLVLISNLDLGQISRLFDDRVASRIGAGTVVSVEHTDMRLEKTSG
jgi:DNA replication protein DnaC